MAGRKKADPNQAAQAAGNTLAKNLMSASGGVGPIEQSAPTGSSMKSTEKVQGKRQSFADMALEYRLNEAQLEELNRGRKKGWTLDQQLEYMQEALFYNMMNDVESPMYQKAIRAAYDKWQAVQKGTYVDERNYSDYDLDFERDKHMEELRDLQEKEYIDPEEYESYKKLHPSQRDALLKERMADAEKRKAWSAEDEQRQRTRDTVSKALGAYKMHPALLAANIAGNIAVPILSAVGNIANIKNSSLANALLDSTQRPVFGVTQAQAERYGSPYTGAARAAAAYGYQGRGQASRERWNATARAIQGALGTLNKEHEMNRLLRLQLENRPSGAIYDEIGRIGRRIDQNNYM